MGIYRMRKSKYVVLFGNPIVRHKQSLFERIKGIFKKSGG